MRLSSTIYADTSAVDRKKSPRERRNGGKRNTRVYAREETKLWMGLKLKKGRRKRDRPSFSFQGKRAENGGGDTFILGAPGLYPLKRSTQNNVERHIRVCTDRMK